MSSRGTDRATEERRIRPREPLDPLRVFLADAFDATAEVIIFTLPVLLWAVIGAPAETTSVVLVATLVSSAAVTVFRNGLVVVGPGWPNSIFRAVGFRLLYYNGLFLLIAGVERYLAAGDPATFSWVPLAAAGVAVVLSVVGMTLFPLAGRAVRAFWARVW